VGPRAGLYAVVSKKIPASTGTRTPIIQPVAQRYTTPGSYVYVCRLYKAFQME